MYPQLARTAFRNRGITMLELMVIVTIGSIMMIASGYTFVTSGQNQLGQQLATQVASALRYARTQAMNAGAGVSVCPATDETLSVCSTISTDWNNGWIVFSDSNNDGVIATSTDILQVYPMTGKNPNITSASSSPFASYASFNSSGVPVSNKRIQMNIEPTGCTGDYGRNVYLTAAGRVVITNVSCSGAGCSGSTCSS